MANWPGASETVALNLSGQIHRYIKSDLTSIDGSKLERIVAGTEAVDEDGNPYIECDATDFKHVHTYLVHDRTVLPEDPGIRVNVEQLIVNFGLDKGLARPGTLTSNIAKQL